MQITLWFPCSQETPPSKIPFAFPSFHYHIPDNFSFAFPTQLTSVPNAIVDLGYHCHQQGVEIAIPCSVPE
jgi:hypothetical protein